MTKLNASAKFDGEHLVLSINGKEVRKTAVLDKSSYTFRYNGEEYNFIYEGETGKGKVFLYPPSEFEQTMIKI